MIGRAPVSMPYMGQSFPLEAYPGPFAPPGPSWTPEGGMGGPPFAPPRNAPVVRQPSTPAPRFRAQGPDEGTVPVAARPAPAALRPSPLALPSPEQLGVASAGPAATAAVD